MPELHVDPALAPTMVSEPEVPTRVRRGADRTSPEHDPAALLPRGAVVAGQYRIDVELGIGGMGVVYRAYDQRLGRVVALKVCRALGARALARLEREAMALARLCHPNVVTMYQVGEQDGRLFLVMEAVTGGTARAWVAGRTWREIVALYAAAGEGLFAAHAAGLVHRDFKPDNVLVGGDGRPRVGDFGLAHAAATASGELAPALGSGEVTAAGAILGTPAYMAPEQRAGRPLDARADQYAFCVALWEALFGELPYASTSRRARRPAPTARGGGPVPRHVVDALRRGLAAAPGDRWPSMAALVAELRRDPRAPATTRARAVAGCAALAAAAVLGAVVFALARPAGAAPCGGGAARLAPVWSPARAAAVREAVGPAAWASLEPALARFADGWIAGDAAARGAGRATPAAAATRARWAACLARSRAELDGFLEELTAYPAPAPALAALARLTAPAACAAVDPRAGEPPPPADPGAITRIERAARAIARAEATLARGARLRASLVTNDALVLARAAGWPAQIAQALVLRADALAASGRDAEARAALAEARRLSIADGADAAG